MSPFRYMKTTQEIRALEALEVDSKDREFKDFHFRSRRSTIPSAWDDIHHTRKAHSWKDNRHTQWH